MKISVHRTSSSITVTVHPEVSLCDSIRVSRHMNLADFTWKEMARVNWPSIGSVDPEEAVKFSKAIVWAAHIADSLNKLDDPTTFKEPKLS